MPFYSYEDPFLSPKPDILPGPIFRGTGQTKMQSQDYCFKETWFWGIITSERQLPCPGGMCLGDLHPASNIGTTTHGEPRPFVLLGTWHARSHCYIIRFGNRLLLLSNLDVRMGVMPYRERALRDCHICQRSGQTS